MPSRAPQGCRLQVAAASGEAGLRRYSPAPCSASPPSILPRLRRSCPRRCSPGAGRVRPMEFLGRAAGRLRRRRARARGPASRRLERRPRPGALGDDRGDAARLRGVVLLAKPASRLALLLMPYLLLLGVLPPRSSARGRFLPMAAGPAAAWLDVHILVSVLTYALVTLAAVAGLAVLLQESALKRRRPTRADAAPALGRRCERLELRLMAVAELVLGLGLLTGMATEYMEQRPIDRVRPQDGLRARRLRGDRRCCSGSAVRAACAGGAPRASCSPPICC